jgi:hypothetical protein
VHGASTAPHTRNNNPNADAMSSSTTFEQRRYHYGAARHRQ